MEATDTLRVTEALEEKRDAFIDRLLGSVSGLFDIFALYMGDRLGYYESLSSAGWMNAGELAEQSGTAERYAREWLEQQTVTGVLEVQDETASAETTLPASGGAR